MTALGGGMSAFVRVLKSPQRLSTSPVISRLFAAGTEVFVGEPAANRAYVVAIRAREPGGQWRTLGCYATVLASALESA